MKNKLKINIFFQSPASKKLERKKALLRKIAGRALKKIEKKNFEVSVIFTSDAKIKKINKTHLAKNRLTDVIAFNYPLPGIPAKDSPLPFGDIFICYKQAARQAREMKHSVLKECAILTIHGCLHLLGYEDYTPQDKARMDKAAGRIIM